MERRIRVNGQLVTLLTLMLICMVTVLAFPQSNVGEVQIYVFGTDGLPVEGVQLELAGEVYESNSSGLINFVHPPGTHEFTLMMDGKPVARVSVPIRQAKVSELIVTANPDIVDVQEGEQAAKAARDEIESQERMALDGDQPTGNIVGVVTEFESGEPVPEATIIFRGVDFETSTDDEGRFVATVPEGEYSFSVIHPDFSTQTTDGVMVTQGDDSQVAVELTPSAFELEEVQVFGAEEVIVQGGIANLIEETRNSSAVMNLIGQEQIGRTGDSDAAGALKRVTGMTVVGGRFVYVRGMGERYSSSLLNGARLPSPEPDRRVVPLDLFPTSVIESIAVQKSYAPNLSGEFGGGTISIRSAGIPDDRYQRRLRTDVGVSVGFNDGTTFTEQLVESPAGLDWLGVDDGTRRLPDRIDKEDYVFPERVLGGTDYLDLDPGDVDELGKLLDNTFSPTARTIPLNLGVNGSVRDKIELSEDASLGYNVAVLYSNSWNYDEGVLNNYVKDDTVQLGYSAQNEYTTEATGHDVDVGALVDLVYRRGRQLELEATSLLVRTTDSTTEVIEGFYGLDGDDIQTTELAWTENTLFSQLVGGAVALESLNRSTLNYQYMFALANRYKPDNRYTFYEEAGGTLDGNFDDDNKEASTRRDNDQQRVWTNVRDMVHDISAYLEIPFFLSDTGAPDYLDVGVYGMYQDRGTDLRRFGYEINGNVVSLGPEELFNDEYIDYSASDGVQFKEVTTPVDNYTARHIMGAGYAQTDILLPNSWRVNAGVRLEYSDQMMSTYEYFLGEEVETTGQLTTLDVLPALNITVPTGTRSQVRVGGSRTVNRPGLRELSLAPFYGPPGFGVERGNPNLQKAVLWNGDLRWEAYLSMNESVSVGAFYKYFDGPIETVTVYGPNKERVPINITSAQNFGLELEWALQLRMVSNLVRRSMMGLSFDSLEREQRWRRRLGAVAGFFRDLRTTGNIAFINSQIDFGGAKEVLGATISNTEDQRPLEGQAPYVINAALGYRNEVSWSLDTPLHTSVFLNYNVVGPHITRVGVQGVPDRYLQPFHQLDLVFRQQLGYIWSIGAEVGNIIDPLATETLGPDRQDPVVEEYRKGRTFSLSVKASL